MKKIKVMSVFGARPDAIKMAPLVIELKKYGQIESSVCVTAQHRQMLDSVLDTFKLKPDFDLNIMEESQTLTTITTKSLIGLEKVFKSEAPDVVLVHGDTSTCFSAALAAFYQKIPVGHVEAGLRSFDKYSPYPEEMNRILTGKIAALHFCPTVANRDNLIREGIKDGLFITGNTVIDAMKHTVDKNYTFTEPKLREIDFNKNRVIFMTAHRRENYGQPFKQIFAAINRLTRDFPDILVVYSVHLSPVVQQAAHEAFSDNGRVLIIPPVNLTDAHNLMDRCYMVMTDSGGLQEEAPALGKPVLVLRRETERPEAVAAGTVKLAGVDEEPVYRMAAELLTSRDTYESMSKAVNPYGDGEACQRIVRSILWHFGMGERPADFSPAPLCEV